MSYLHNVSPSDATHPMQDVYKSMLEKLGYIPNYAQAFSLRPDVYIAWTQLVTSVRGHLRLRRYELITLVAAQALHCTYCVLAHGDVLRHNSVSDEELVAILTDFRNAALDPAEVTIMAFAQKVIQGAHEITREDIDKLRQHGLEDDAILDVILTAAARSFFSTVLNAVGAVPDPTYDDLAKTLRSVVTYDKRIASQGEFGREGYER